MERIVLNGRERIRNIEDNRLLFKIIKKIEKSTNEDSFINNNCEWN